MELKDLFNDVYFYEKALDKIITKDDINQFYMSNVDAVEGSILSCVGDYEEGERKTFLELEEHIRFFNKYVKDSLNSEEIKNSKFYYDLMMYILKKLKYQRMLIRLIVYIKAQRDKNGYDWRPNNPLKSKIRTRTRKRR